MTKSKTNPISLCALWFKTDGCKKKVLHGRFALTSNEQLGSDIWHLRAEPSDRETSGALDLILLESSVIMRLDSPSCSTKGGRWFRGSLKRLEGRGDQYANFIVSVPTKPSGQEEIAFRVHVFGKARQLEITEVDPADRLRLLALFEGLDLAVR